MEEESMLIVLEGVDKIGKTTIANEIHGYLNLINKRSFILNEMETVLGMAVKLALQDKTIDNSAKIVMIRQLRKYWLDNMISNLIYNDIIVILDRFVMSTIVYQKIYLDKQTEEFRRYDEFAFTDKILTLLFTTSKTNLLAKRMNTEDPIEVDVAENIVDYQNRFKKTFKFFQDNQSTHTKNMHNIVVDTQYPDIKKIIPYINKFLQKEV